MLNRDVPKQSSWALDDAALQVERMVAEANTAHVQATSNGKETGVMAIQPALDAAAAGMGRARTDSVGQTTIV